MQEIEGPKNPEVLNILMLGETGVSKSTFINAFVNYTAYDSLTTAKNSDLHCLIPSKFTITDENYKQRVIEIGEDDNENTGTGNSATQAAKAYIFQIKSGEENFSVRFIDTPGIGDVRGIEQDERNFENVLHFISQYTDLHGICILLKPNNARLTAQFEFCLNKLFCQLEKSASQNIIFVFTNSRGTFYRPGDTLPVLEKLLERVAQGPPYVRIQTEKTNMYCFDNEAFRFLAAVKNGVQFTEEDEDNFACSWEQSSKECWRLLDYARGKDEITFLPHKVADTISVNKARNFIFQLSRPLADITQLIGDNILLMERHKDDLNKEGLTLTELKDKLYIPQTDVRLKELSQPVTVCAAPSCVQPYTVNGKTVSHFAQRCHNPCSLTNVPKEIIGSPELINCTAMSGGRNCTRCGCSYTVHQHIYYETELFENNIVDVNVNQTITTKEQAVAYSKTLIKTLSTTIKSFEDERAYIIKSLAKFSHFLANNAITPYNDAYKQYFKYLIDRERALGEKCDKDAVSNLESMLAKYDEERNILNIALNERVNAGITEHVVVTADDVTAVAKTLYALKNFGQSIRAAFQIQSRAQALEFKNDEYRHRTVLHRHMQNITYYPENLPAGNTVFICGLPVGATKKKIAQLFQEVCRIQKDGTMKISINKNPKPGKRTIEAVVTFPSTKTAELAVLTVNGKEYCSDYKLSLHMVGNYASPAAANSSDDQYAMLAYQTTSSVFQSVYDTAYSMVAAAGMLGEQSFEDPEHEEFHEAHEVLPVRGGWGQVIQKTIFFWKK